MSLKAVDLGVELAECTKLVSLILRVSDNLQSAAVIEAGDRQKVGSVHCESAWAGSLLGVFYDRL